MRSKTLLGLLGLTLVVLLSALPAKADSITIGTFTLSASGPGSVTVVDPSTGLTNISMTGSYLILASFMNTTGTLGSDVSPAIPLCYTASVSLDSSFLFSISSCSGIGGGTSPSLSAGNHTILANVTVTLSGGTTILLSDGSTFIADSATYNYTFPVSEGNPIEITGTIVATPEPATFGLLCAGILAVGLRRRWMRI